jgi:hypothetical protein
VTAREDETVDAIDRTVRKPVECVSGGGASSAVTVAASSSAWLGLS